MARIILHKDGAYNVFSTVVDAPLWESALTLAQLTQVTREEEGELGVQQLEQRLQRAHKQGTSYVFEQSLEQTLACNRAGPSGEKMSTEAFIAQYLTLADVDKEKEPSEEGS